LTPGERENKPGQIIQKTNQPECKP